jgi:hypothetical protein
MMFRRAMVLIAATAAMTFAGCGDDDSGGGTSETTAPPETIEPTPVTAGTQAQTAPACDLLTVEVAEEVLGGPAEQETALGTEDSGNSTCEYVGQTDEVLGLGIVTFESADEASDAFGMSRLDTQFDEIEFEDVEGFGPGGEFGSAFFMPDSPNHSRTVTEVEFVFGELVVLDGLRVYSVWVSPSSLDVTKQAMEAVLTS